MDRIEMLYANENTNQIKNITGYIGKIRYIRESGCMEWQGYKQDDFGKDLMNSSAEIVDGVSKKEYFIGCERIDLNGFAFFVKYEKYAISIRVYNQKFIDYHIDKSRNGIRFIDSGYNELFRTQDGDVVVIKYPSGGETILTVRYIDSYHIELTDKDGREITAHICEFAEMVEKTNATVKPYENRI